MDAHPSPSHQYSPINILASTDKYYHPGILNMSHFQYPPPASGSDHLAHRTTFPSSSSGSCYPPTYPPAPQAPSNGFHVYHPTPQLAAPPPNRFYVPPQNDFYVHQNASYHPLPNYQSAAPNIYQHQLPNEIELHPRNAQISKPTPHPPTQVPNFVNDVLLTFEANRNEFYSEQELLSSLNDVLSTPSFGIYGFNTQRSVNNPVQHLRTEFPHKSFTWVCKTCSIGERAMPPTTQGCCGLMIQVSFVSHKTEKPHLLIKKFTLPVTSKHVIITPQERASTATEPIKHESQLSEEQTILLKALGTARLPAYSIKSVMKTVHPKLNMGNNLIWRVRKKGLSEKFGGDEDTSLVIFMHHGQKWNDNEVSN